jgi:hypothetical protein
MVEALQRPIDLGYGVSPGVVSAKGWPRTRSAEGNKRYGHRVPWTQGHGGIPASLRAAVFVWRYRVGRL